MSDDVLAKNIAQLIDSSNKKFYLLQIILELTKKQKDLLENENIDILENIIDEKQKIIDQINVLDNNFEILFKELSIKYNIKKVNDINKSSILGEELKTIITNIIELIKIISELEHTNNNNAIIYFEKLKNEIKKNNLGKAALKGYKPQEYGLPSYYIDKKK